MQDEVVHMFAVVMCVFVEHLPVLVTRAGPVHRLEGPHAVDGREGRGRDLRVGAVHYCDGRYVRYRDWITVDGCGGFILLISEYAAEV